MNAIAPITPLSVKGPFAVLDAGSSKLACIIVEPVGNNQLNIISSAMHASAGVQRGEISDLSAFSETIGRVVEIAEGRTGMQIKELHVVMPGGRPASQIGRYELELADSLVSKRDIKRLLAKQFQAPLGEGRSLIQTEELGYIIDGQTQVKNPKGMRAHHLALDSTALTIGTNSYFNVKEAVEHNHLRLGRISHSAYAAGLSCLNEEERDLGTLLLDLGGGTSSAALFLHDSIIGIATIPIGGLHITRDIANILSISLNDAERLKAMEGSITPSHGEALGDIISPPPFTIRGDNFVPATAPYQNQEIALPNGEMVSRQLLADIIRPRIEELLDLVEKRLIDGGLGNHIGKRVVLTGGASQLTGISDFISQYWKRNVRLAQSSHILGLDDQTAGPAFSAAIGMAIQIMNSADSDQIEFHPASYSQSPFGRFGMWLKTHL